MKRAPLPISVRHCFGALARRLLTGAILLGVASAAAAQEAVFVVRHAERLDQSADSLLSEAGAARARRLAEMLKSAGITHVFTSERRRTIDTAAPLAAAVHAKTTPVPAADTPALAAQISALGSHDRVLVVGHSNTVPDLLRALHVDTTLAIPDDEFDNLFVVMPQKNAPPTMLRLKY